MIVMTTTSSSNNEHSESGSDIQSNPETQGVKKTDRTRGRQNDVVEDWHEWVKRVTQQAEHFKENSTFTHGFAQSEQEPGLPLTWAPKQTSKTARRGEGHLCKRFAASLIMTKPQTLKVL